MTSRSEEGSEARTPQAFGARALLVGAAVLAGLSCVVDEESPVSEVPEGRADGFGAGWCSPDPRGRATEGNEIGLPAEMVIVTSSELASAWEPLAEHHTRGGLRTRVVQLEDALAGRPGGDDAARLRAYLAEAHGQGLGFALLGGDAEVVPIRRALDAIVVPAQGTFESRGPAEAYFADLDGEWDRDGDGVPDVRLEDLRDPEIAVGRVPARSAAEVARYVRRVVAYEAWLGGSRPRSLALSDVAGEVPLLGEIDAAVLLDPTLEALLPDPLWSGLTRLYATPGAVDFFGGEALSDESLDAALAEGPGLVAHYGHGAVDSLLALPDGRTLRSLDSPAPAVLLSCACLAGDFADRANERGRWEVQGPGERSAGERFVLDAGSGVAYVGNVAVGLGPLGGAQLIHALLDAAYSGGHGRLGEALSEARRTMGRVTLWAYNVPMPMTPDSERWTQLSVLLLGDPAIHLPTGPARPLRVEGPASFGPGYEELAFRVLDAGTGLPVEGATVVLDKPGDLLLGQRTDAEGRALFRVVPCGRGPATATVTGEGLQRSELTLTPR